MGIHLVEIGNRLKDRFDTLMAQLVTDGDLVEAPPVRLRKRVLGRGRSTDEMEVFSGRITIAPLGPDPSGGTNQREDYAYRFLAALGGGTYNPLLDTDWTVATWEQAIHRRFQQSRIGVSLSNGCEIATTCKPGKLPDNVKLTEDLDVTLIELVVWVRELRRSDN